MTVGVRKSQELRAAGAARKGGTPGEGSPFDPLLRFFGDGEFRALRRAAKGSAPGPRPHEGVWRNVVRSAVDER